MAGKMLSPVLLVAILIAVCSAMPGSGGHGGKHMGRRGQVNFPDRVDANGIECSSKYLKSRIAAGTGNKIFMFKELQAPMDDDMEGGEDMGENDMDGGDMENGDMENGEMDDGEMEGDDMEGGHNGMGHHGRKGKYTRPLVWKMNKIEEVDAEGAAVEGHAIENFESIMFECSETENDVEIPNSDDGDGSAIHAAELVITGSHTVGDAAAPTSLQFNVYISKGNGTVTNGDEILDVHEGQVKFSLHIEDWPFAETGDQLHVELEVDSKGPPRRRSGSGQGNGFSLEGDAEVVFSSVAQTADGAFVALPAEVESGDDGTFVLALSKFDTSITYDPINELGDEEDEDEDNGENEGEDDCEGDTCGAPAWTSFTLITALFAMLAAAFNL